MATSVDPRGSKITEMDCPRRVRSSIAGCLKRARLGHRAEIRWVPCQARTVRWQLSHRFGLQQFRQFVRCSLDRRAAPLHARLDEDALQRRNTKDGDTFGSDRRKSVSDQLAFDDVNSAGIRFSAGLGHPSVLRCKLEQNGCNRATIPKSRL